MSRIVIVTFDLKAGSGDDYNKVYDEFKKIGLSKELISDNGIKVNLPTTTTAGEFTGTNSSSISEEILKKCEAIFKKIGVNGEIFVMVGDDWSWRRRVL